MEKTYRFDYEHYDSTEQLSAQDRELIAAARKACQSAWAPYSDFRVGAAARLESGRILLGSNQESEVFPAGICAERSLLFHQQATCPQDRIVALAIASVPDERECYPCGICRQVLNDVEKRQGSPIRVLMSGRPGITVVNTTADLLPFLFRL